MNKKNKKNNKELYIEVNEHILTLVQNYCKDANIDETEFGYLFGSVVGDSDGIKEKLTELTRIFFFAGIHFTKQNNEYTYKFKTETKEKSESKMKANYFG